MRLLLIVLVLASALFAASPVVSGNYEVGAFGNGEFPLLFEMHKITVGEGRQSFVYPSRNCDFHGELCDSCFWKTNGNISASVWNSGFGGEAFFAGFVDSVDFDIDVKFNWIRESDKIFAELDGESVHEVWDDGGDWINYTRFRGHFGYNYAWLRLEMGHDAMHWGPAYYNNLTLNRRAVPYNYFSVDFHFGPLRVISFYGRMRIDSANVYTHEYDDRNLYGHRYELALGNATFGINELQMVHNENNPWLLVPVFPLFIEKGNYSEINNNGAISLDANYRIGHLARIYGEFYLDDMESPITVIKNEYMNSEWAWMLGAQIGHDFTVRGKQVQTGSVFEFTHMEQLVYTHFRADEAQMANAGRPIGNPSGPNSRNIDWLLYGKVLVGNTTLIFSLLNSWFWKGTVFGSYLNENMVPKMETIPKNYLGGAKMHYSITPTLTFERPHYGLTGSFRFGYEAESNVKGWVRW